MKINILPTCITLFINSDSAVISNLTACYDNGLAKRVWFMTNTSRDFLFLTLSEFMCSKTQMIFILSFSFQSPPFMYMYLSVSNK